MASSSIIRVFLLGCCVVVFGFGCDDSDDCYQESYLPPPENIAEIPETLAVEDLKLVLDHYLWRDFMPGPNSSPDGKPLIAVVRLVEVDSVGLTAGLEMDHLWVYSEQGSYWSTEFTDEPRAPTADFKQERVARCGPKWGPGVEVDLVVRIRGFAGEPRYIKRTDVPIEQTD